MGLAVEHLPTGDPLYQNILRTAQTNRTKATRHKGPDKKKARNPIFSRKEVFQPHLPVRLPCYDLALVTNFALGRSSR